jgi:hypothetical protein
VGQSLGEGEVTDILLRWQSGVPVKQIVRSTGHSRNTVRKYVSAVTRAGVARDGDLSSRELWAAVAGDPLRAVAAGRPRHSDELHVLRQEIRDALATAPVAAMWRRLRAEGRISVSLSTFQRFVRRLAADAPTVNPCDLGSR